jgi:hypothetical protein
MARTQTNQTFSKTPTNWRNWFALAAFWAVSLYLWIVPLFYPRGLYFWGHTRLYDIYAGIPIGIVTLCLTVVMLTPLRFRRQVAMRLTVIAISLIALIFLFDAFYALVIMGGWRSSYWLDQAHIPRRYSREDSILGFTRRPGITWVGQLPFDQRTVEYRTDEHGFRNPPSIGQADLVFIGDSYTEAAQVNEADTFVQRIGKAAGAKVVNLGLGSYGPQQELLVLQRYGLSYQPRIVIWQVFEGNYISDAENFSDWKANGHQWHKPFKHRYADNSLINRLFAWTVPLPRTTTVARLRYHDQTEQPLFIRYKYQPQLPLQSPAGFQAMRDAIETGYRLCQEKGIHLIVMPIPVMVRVLEPWITFDPETGRETYLPGGVVNATSDLNSALKKLCEQLGCAYIDPYEALRRRASIDNRGLYIPSDEHLDVAGHSVIADLVVEQLPKSLVAH